MDWKGNRMAAGPEWSWALVGNCRFNSLFENQLIDKYTRFTVCLTVVVYLLGVICDGS